MHSISRILFAALIVGLTAPNEPASAQTATDVKLCVPATAARSVSVSSSTALQAALNAARPGDVITVKRGSYRAAALKIARSGTAEQPIVIRAESRGKVTITGPQLAFSITASNVVVSGFVFDRATLNVAGASGVRITDNVFTRSPATTSSITLRGTTFTRVDHNRFEGITGKGISIRALAGPVGAAATLPKSNRIDRNHLKNFTGSGSNGHEGIVVGLHEPLYFDTGFDTLIERNHFENVAIDPEAISVKSSGNTILANTFRIGSRNSITIRAGNDNLVMQNVMFGSDGIRVHGRGNRIVENHLQRTNRGIRLMAGNGDGTSLSLRDSAGNIVHDAAIDTQVLRNTIVDSREPGIVSGCLPVSSGSAGCAVTADRYPVIVETTNATITGNIVLMTSSTAVPITSLRGLPPMFADNLAWSTVGTVPLADPGIAVVDPLLTLSNGRYVPSAATPTTAGAPAVLEVMGLRTAGPGTPDPVCAG